MLGMSDTPAPSVTKPTGVPKPAQSSPPAAPAEAKPKERVVEVRSIADTEITVTVVGIPPLTLAPGATAKVTPEVAEQMHFLPNVEVA